MVIAVEEVRAYFGYGPLAKELYNEAGIDSASEATNA